MSAPSPVSEVPAKGRPLQLAESVLQGRLIKIQKRGDNIIHLVVLPAPDSYTAPATVEIIAKTRLGQPEDDIRVRVRIGGYRRTYNATDRETGETRAVTTADVRLFAVED